MDGISNEVLEKIRENIKIPKKKGKPFIIGTIGLVGSGKTTVIKPIAEHFNLIRFSSDEARHVLKDNNLEYKFIKDLLSHFSKEFLDLGFGLALDADCGSPETRILMESFSKKYNIPIFWLHINPPEEFILNVNKRRNSSNSLIFGNGEEAVLNYFRQKETRENQDYLKNIDFMYEFDTSKEDVDSQITSAIQRIEETLNTAGQ